MGLTGHNAGNVGTITAPIFKVVQIGVFRQLGDGIFFPGHIEGNVNGQIGCSDRDVVDVEFPPFIAKDTVVERHAGETGRSRYRRTGTVLIFGDTKVVVKFGVQLVV